MTRNSKFVFIAAILCAVALPAQDLPSPKRGADITVIISGLPPKPRKMAVADFQQSSKPGSASTEPLTKVFNDVLWADLEASGLFEMVSKSFYPKDIPGRADEMTPQRVATWAAPPTSTETVAFGTLTTINDNFAIDACLFDTTVNTNQAILLKRYASEALPESARTIAHRFANEIILRLGGTPGIGESKIYFTSNRSGAKEVWSMDYDGYGQHQVTHHNSLVMSPAISPDGSKLAYMENDGRNNNIHVLSLETNRMLSFQNQRGTNYTPSWSADSKHILLASSFTGDPEIYMADVNGGNMKRLTNSPGVDNSPVVNPRTGQIAFVSDRAGHKPVIYMMEADGSNVRKLSGTGGDAVTPAWSPNGQLLAFSWTAGYAPGNYNIFVMEVSSGHLAQLTYGAGANEHPSWAPDGRHIVFESNRGNKFGKQIFSMLADGTQVKALTSTGTKNETPAWSAR